MRCAALLVACLAFGWSTAGADTKEQKPVIKTKSGLKYIEEKTGDGATAKRGDTVVVHYTGWLKDGKKIESTKDKDKPYSFTLGKRMMIRGFDEGVEGMKVGGKRRLFIPYELGYGNAGSPPDIPPKAELIFEVDLVRVR